MTRAPYYLAVLATMACGDPSPPASVAPAPTTQVAPPPPPAPFRYEIATSWDDSPAPDEITGLSVTWRTQLRQSCDVDFIARVDDTLMTCCDEDVYVLDPGLGTIRHRTIMPGVCDGHSVVAAPHGLVLAANVLEMAGDTPLSRSAYVTRIGTDGQPVWYTPLDVDRIEGLAEVDGHVVAVGRHVEHGGGDLYTLDPETGRIVRNEHTAHTMSGITALGSHVLVWSEGTPGLFEWLHPGTRSLADRIPTEVVVHGDHAILLTHSDPFADVRYGEIEARDTASLETRWSHRLDDDGPVSIGGDVAALIETDARHRNTLVVLDGATGAERWHRALGTRDVFSLGVAAPFVVAEQGGDTQVYALSDGHPLGTGELWSAPPVIEDDHVFVALPREIVRLTLPQ